MAARRSRSRWVSSPTARRTPTRPARTPWTPSRAPGRTSGCVTGVVVRHAALADGARAGPGRLRPPAPLRRDHRPLTHKGSSSILCEFLNADGRWYDDEASVAVFKTSGTVMIEGTRRTCPGHHHPGSHHQPHRRGGTHHLHPDGVHRGRRGLGEHRHRPRHNSILTSAGGSVAGKLSPTSTSLSAGSLRPGTHATSLTGTGTTSATGYEVSWRKRLLALVSTRR